MIGTVNDLIAYAKARGVEIGADEAPVLLVKATDYMNTFSWKGKQPAGQEDCWPRENVVYDGTDLIYDDGQVITVIEHSDGSETDIKEGDIVGTPAVTPRSIFTATYRIATLIGEGTEIQAVTGGARVTQESVSGAVSVSYAEGTVNDAIVIPGFDGHISPWLASPINRGINFSVMRS